MADRPLALAVIVGAHGVKGEVRLKLFAESLESFRRHTSFGARGQSLTLISVRAAGKAYIARFKEIVDRDAAEKLRGAELTVSRSDLPPLEEGEFYLADLVGRPAVTTSGEALGTVVAVHNFGAGDILEIERPDQGRFMVPFSEEAVPGVGEVLAIHPAFCEAS